MHNFNKGCRQGYSSSHSLVTQQIIKCSTCVERGKLFSYPLHNLIVFQIYKKKTSNRTKFSSHNQLY
jgi:hypothetical protein